MKMPLTHIIQVLQENMADPHTAYRRLPWLRLATAPLVRLRSIDGPEQAHQISNGVERCTHPSALGPLGSVLRASPELGKALTADAKAGAILHAHGLWLMPNIYPARAKRHARASRSSFIRLAEC